MGGPAVHFLPAFPTPTVARGASADEAMKSMFVPQSELLALANKMAVTIASKAPLAISAALECIVEGIDESIEEGLSREAGMFGQLTTSFDFHEGTTAFMEKRKAEFQGK